MVAKKEEKVKAMQSEIKENVQGTNRKRKETRIQINSLDQSGEINIHQNRMKKKELKNMSS